MTEPIDPEKIEDWQAWIDDGSDQPAKLPEHLVKQGIEMGVIIEYPSNEPQRKRTLTAPNGRRYELTEGGIHWLSSAIKRELARAEAEAAELKDQASGLRSERDRLAELLNGRSESGSAVLDPISGEMIITDEGDGFSPEELQDLLSGGLSVGEVTRRSPAAAVAFGAMPGLWEQIAKAHLQQSSQDNPLWGPDIVEELTIVGVSDPRITEDKAILDMLAKNHVQLVGYDPSDPHNAEFLLTSEGYDVAIGVVADDYGLPYVEHGKVRCLVMPANGEPYYELKDWDGRNGPDDEALHEWVSEQVGGVTEAVYIFARSARKFPPMNDTGKAIAIAYVNDDGHQLPLPMNLRATAMLHEVGALEQDIGPYIAGNMVVFALKRGAGLDHDFDRELPQEIHQFVNRETADEPTRILGIKECTTEELRRLSANSYAEGLRWTLDTRVDVMLDPLAKDGERFRHLLNVLVVLDHDENGLPVEPFIRCRIIAKARNSATPLEQERFDVRLRDFAALPSADIDERGLTKNPATRLNLPRTALDPDENTPPRREHE